MKICTVSGCTAGCNTCTGAGRQSCQSCDIGFYHDGSTSCIGKIIYGLKSPEQLYINNSLNQYGNHSFDQKTIYVLI